MKLSFITLAAMAMLTLPMMATAQVPLVPGSVELAAAGGISMPTGDFGDLFDAGYGVGAVGSFYVMPQMAVGGTIVYNSYNMKNEIGDMTLSMWEFSGHGKYLFMPGPITPYAKAQIGMYSASMEGFESTNDWGVAGGVGAQMRLPTSPVGFFLEGMYNNVFTDPSSTNYMSVRGGVNFYVNMKP